MFIGGRLCASALITWVILCLVSPEIRGEARVQVDPPNLIFLLTDDQRWDSLGSYGNSIVQTPHIDGLAAEGVLFENMFVTTSICALNRASILMGQYVSRHGIKNFRAELNQDQLNKSYLGVLKSAGYRLGFIGKWGVGQPPQALFDFNRGFPGQGRYFLEVAGQPRHLTSVMGDQALEFLEESSVLQPFCLSVSFKAAHVQDSDSVTDDPFPFDPALENLYRDVVIPSPLTAARAFFERLPVFLKNSEARQRWAVRFWGPERYQESVKGYYRLVSGVDVVVGRILEKLREKGFDKNTVIVFSGDNGFFLGEYGLAGKWFPHEVSIRVPLIVHDPRLSKDQRGVRREEIALSIDIAPTLLDLAGLSPPKGTQGSSVLPLVRGQTMNWRREFFYEHPFSHARIPFTEAIRTERWKYIRYLESEPLHEELYDLQQDPQEARNVASLPQHRNLLEEMRGKWRRWRRQVR